MRRRAILFGLVQATAGRAGWAAAAEAGNWIDAEINGMRYNVLLPDAYDAGQLYPVLLYLHQLDMGDYLEGLLNEVNAWFNTPTFRSHHPCIVVMPLLDQKNDKEGRRINFGGQRGEHIGEDNAIAALKQVMGRYAIDSERVYVTGNSMGGMGTWQMLLDYNTLNGPKGRIFAAGLPLAGTNRTTDPHEAAIRLRRVPTWAIHGASDRRVPPDWDRTMSRLLSRSRTFRYTEDPTLGHNVWDRYYTRPAVWVWLFSQGKSGQVPVSRS
jgi:predicted peptidase